jgi:hypothetical protein
MKRLNFKFKEDIESTLDFKKIGIDYFCEQTEIPKRTLLYAFSHNPSKKVLEKAYSYIYKLNIRLNNTKSELFEELKNKNEIVLYHGSKYGIDEIKFDGSREDCDFGKGFYLSKSLSSAISFVNTQTNSCVYAFKLNIKNLKIYELECDLDWMLLISLNRKKIDDYKNHEIIKSIIKKVEEADVLIGPIADNKMFEVMTKFAQGEITTTEAIHSLSASRLGNQYVIKTKNALKNLIFIDRLYLCEKEKEKSLEESKEQEILIQNKLDFAKRSFRGQGKYIDEVLK